MRTLLTEVNAVGAARFATASAVGAIATIGVMPLLALVLSLVAVCVAGLALRRTEDLARDLRHALKDQAKGIEVVTQKAKGLDAVQGQ